MSDESFPTLSRLSILRHRHETSYFSACGICLRNIASALVGWPHKGFPVPFIDVGEVKGIFQVFLDCIKNIFRFM